MEDVRVATNHMGSKVIASGLETAFSNLKLIEDEIEHVRLVGVRVAAIPVQPKKISPSHVLARNPFSLIDGQ